MKTATTQVFIYSVNTNPVKLNHGSLGNFYIPGRGEEPYCHVPIPEVRRRQYGGRVNGKQAPKYELKIMSAEELARDFATRYKSKGIFMVEPGESVAAAAKVAQEKLHKRYRAALLQADTSWQKKKERVRITATAHKAAEALGVKAEWHEQPSIAETRSCPACGNDVRLGALKCTVCQEVLDHEGMKAMRERAKTAGGGVWAAGA